VYPPPEELEPPQAKTNISNAAKQTDRLSRRRRLARKTGVMASNSRKVHPRPPGGTLQGVDEGAVVVTVTVKGVPLSPIVIVEGVTVHVAPVGAPEQVSVAVPV
jgi:hypothetical protein